MRRASFGARLLRLEQSRLAPVGETADTSLPVWMAEGKQTEPDPDWRYQALPSQLSFHRDLTTPFKGYSGPIGSGKSYALVYEAILLSRINAGLLGFVGAPTYPMLR